MADAYVPPITRFPPGRVQDQAHRVGRAREEGRLQHGLDELAMVVNEARQIVYVSPGLESIFCESVDEDSSGKRPGELFGCVHAGVDRCGLTESCEFCGAAAAILHTQQTSKESSRECVITTGGNGHRVTYNFAVRGFPLSLGSDRFVMILLDDISGEKHRAALERVFFHDILNTVTGLQSYLALLKRQVSSEPDRELVVRIGEITGMLVEEIQSQKVLASAENGTLRPARQFVVSSNLVESLMVQYADHDLTRGKRLEASPLSETLSCTTDETILRRVLGNMVKNALEASGPGDAVTMGCRRDGTAAVFYVHNPGVVSKEIRHQIFNRFFSTKGNSRGLGTYSMRLLAEGFLEGRVWFTSDKENGTTFSVSIPRNE